MRYADIRSMDISNGLGVGIALFVQGCHFKCHNCFNKSTWDFNGGKEWTEEKENKFIELANKPYVTRISLLGGEPLAKENLSDMFKLVSILKGKYPDKKIWLYTGYKIENIYSDNIDEKDILDSQLRRKIIETCNVLVDGQFIDKLKDMNLKFRGSSNQRLINMQESLKQKKIVLLDL